MEEPFKREGCDCADRCQRRDVLDAMGVSILESIDNSGNAGSSDDTVAK
jgi:hypothetical protein